jgi:hypothetical protein
MENTVIEKINQIKQKLSSYSLIYVDIPDHGIDIIHGLFVNNITPSNTYIDSMNDDIIHLYCGVYYRCVKRNYDHAVSYYLLAIEKGAAKITMKL